MRTLLIIILIIFIGSWIIRRLAPLLLLRLFKQYVKHSEKANTPSRKEGEVNVRDTHKREKKKINKEVGEYVDFEEV